MNLNLAADGGSVEISDATFAREFNEALVHQVVVAQMAGARQGSRAQKNRSDARGGGRKPWRQKGTGRARAGTIRSPIWRSGGVTFAARPQDHSVKVNRKMYRGALRCIVSELIRQDRLVAIDSFSVQAPKTKALLEQLKSLDLASVLIITEEVGVQGAGTVLNDGVVTGLFLARGTVGSEHIGGMRAAPILAKISQ